MASLNLFTHQVGLGTDFQIDTSGGALGVVDSLGTSLNVAVAQTMSTLAHHSLLCHEMYSPVDTVVVAGRVG